MLTIHKESHLDHGLTQPQIDYLLSRYADKKEFFKETLELPEELGTVPCGLYGPAMGDDPIADKDAFFSVRGDRKWVSRLYHDGGVRQTRILTIVAGPHDGQECIIYTVYGGPEAPQEPGDPNCRDKGASETFWAVHALAT